jgi:hypothetical protein
LRAATRTLPRIEIAPKVVSVASINTESGEYSPVAVIFWPQSTFLLGVLTLLGTHLGKIRVGNYLIGVRMAGASLPCPASATAAAGTPSFASAGC